MEKNPKIRKINLSFKLSETSEGLVIEDLSTVSVRNLDILLVVNVMLERIKGSMSPDEFQQGMAFLNRKLFPEEHGQQNKSNS